MKSVRNRRHATGPAWAVLCASCALRPAAGLEVRGLRGRPGLYIPDILGNPSRRDGVTAEPDVQVHEPQPEKRWNLEGDEGGSSKSSKWRSKKGGGPWTFLGAVSFVVLIGSLPAALASSYKYVTRTQVFESILLYSWLLGGLFLFTEVLIFQSPHFSEPRSLSTEEAVYLFAQILTTIGYGDITPARPRGQLCMGLFVVMSVLLIAHTIQELFEFFQTIIERRLGLDDESDVDHDDSVTEEHKLKAAFLPVIYSSLAFCCFVAVGAAFFVYYPGEEKTPAQGVYMALITLSTVGFGAFTPSTHAGMVFGSYWMVFGSASLVSVATSRGAFSLALKHYEVRLLEQRECEQAGYENLSPSSRRRLSSRAGSTRLAESKAWQKQERSALRRA
ncbi:unnamed protein product [Prorocentrum cordatum]|uniref:Potassium channel domain-containing protein n=1 Tax=Prorocentrum cordatum TaxID=2364126 RepID=A0ABN9SLB7_9DINO|nr:unnamed protein product [Polarella glacialis]